MARSTDKRRSLGAVLCVLAMTIGACGGLPSKDEAIQAVQRDVKEDASCTLPIDVLSKLKMQHASKAACAPREGGDKAAACLEALVAFGVTKKMPAGYMRQWPDDVATDPYERRARELLFESCVELVPNLREGRFACGEARADHVLSLKKHDAASVDVRYQRAVDFRPTLHAVDAACGAVTRPPGEAKVTLEKKGATWSVRDTAAAVN